MHIYAAPLKQILQLLVPELSSPILFAVVSIAVTVPFAFLSCRFVEQPALRFKATLKPRSKARV